MYCGYIVVLKDGKKHPNADRLKLYTIFGNQVITDLSYNDNDLVVYFPSDGQFSEEFCKQLNLCKKYKPVADCMPEELDGKEIVKSNGIDCINIGGYLDPNKRNIRAIKLRGEKSDGVVFHVDALKYTGITEFKVGDTVDVLNGHGICQKYIPHKQQRSTNNNEKQLKKKFTLLEESISTPYFAEHKDTAQLAYNESAFHEGDLIYLTRKKHGSSQRTANTQEIIKKRTIIHKLFHIKPTIKAVWKIVTGTRRTVLHDYNGGYYGNNDFRKQYHEFFKNKLPKGMEVFYEVCGWINENTPIMPTCDNTKIKDKEFIKKYGKTTTFTYGCEPGHSRIYVYRITMTNDEGEVIDIPTEQCLIWCEKWGCEFVPILDKFFFTTWEDLNLRVNKWLDLPEPDANGKHIVEGVVVRNESSNTFKAYKQKGFFFKVLEGIIKDTAEAPDIEEAEELIAKDVVGS